MYESDANNTIPIVPTIPYETVTCDEFVAQATKRLNDWLPAANASVQPEEERHLLIKSVVDDCFVPAICLFGIVGNMLNLFVLTRKQLQCTMKPMERSYNVGLAALAVSDMLFCLVYLFVSIVEQKATYTPRDFALQVYFNTYQEPLINIFLLSSTWLTVVMALGRYVAICRPLHARGFINLRATRAAIALVFVGSVIVNLPRFWHYSIIANRCEELRLGLRTSEDDPCPCFYKVKVIGSIYRNSTFKFGYGILWAIVAIFTPMAILVLCNLCLIRALRHSHAMQKMYRANQPKESDHRITPTLIALIILFVVLVGPSEILVFFRDQIVQPSRRDASRYFMFKNAVAIGNCLLLLNFAINVVLYCVINVQFRRVVRTIFCCSALRRRRNNVLMSSIKSYQNTVTCHTSDIETEI